MGTSGLIRDWRYSELSDADDGKNDGLKWRIGDSFCQRNNVFYRYFHFQIFTIVSQRAFILIIFIYSQLTRYDQIMISQVYTGVCNLVSTFCSSASSYPAVSRVKVLRDCKTHHNISVSQFLVERFLVTLDSGLIAIGPVRPLVRI